MKLTDRERLLRDVLADEHLESLRGESLGRTLAAAAKRKRVQRRIRAAAACAALVVTGLLAIKTSDGAKPAAEPAGPVAARPDIAPAPPVAPRSGRVQIITDQQLLALFPGQSAALVGAPGGPRRLLVDRGGKPELQ